MSRTESLTLNTRVFRTLEFYVIVKNLIFYARNPLFSSRDRDLSRILKYEIVKKKEKQIVVEK